MSKNVVDDRPICGALYKSTINTIWWLPRLNNVANLNPNVVVRLGDIVMVVSNDHKLKTFVPEEDGGYGGRWVDLVLLHKDGFICFDLPRRHWWDDCFEKVSL